MSGCLQDVKLTAANDDQYFVFEDYIYQVTGRVFVNMFTEKLVLIGFTCCVLLIMYSYTISCTSTCIVNEYTVIPITDSIRGVMLLVRTYMYVVCHCRSCCRSLATRWCLSTLTTAAPVRPNPICVASWESTSSWSTTRPTASFPSTASPCTVCLRVFGIGVTRNYSTRISSACIVNGVTVETGIGCGMCTK